MQKSNFSFATTKLIAIFLSVCLLSGCTKPAGLTSVTRDDLLGTAITISIYDNVPDRLFAQCFDEIAAIEARMSVNRKDSEISLLNENTGGAFLVSDNIYALLQRAVYFSGVSGGAFDISIGPVMELWRKDGHFETLPSPKEINEKLAYVGYEAITFPGSNMVSMEQGMRLDLGAFAKGHALEVVRDILLENGVRHALLDFGGDIYTIGEKPDGSNWRVAIKTPIVGDNSLVCVIEVSDLCVMTSGGYERYFEQDGIYYHHILNPATGYPAASDLLSVTVISAEITGADALSTAGFVLGLEQGMIMIDKLEGYEAIFITSAKEIYVTAGLKGKTTLLNTGFQLKGN
ncbi:MAG: FAD:protein FMN transferase [Lachnospiraceae bacterium]|nr:FAD:protein FMN transferase [Lachnospiraceae bacterium]